MMKKYQGMKKSFFSWQSFSSLKLNNEIIDKAIHKVNKDSIILLGSPRMEILGDYFHRVRQNTILHQQVYCPIPFTEYHPKIIYRKKVPATLRFQPSLGYFDSLNHQHISFYKDDFDSEKAAVAPDESLQEIFSEEKFHKMVAVEPGLRLRYDEVVCRKDLSQVELRRCFLRRRQSLGKRSQVAVVVMENGL